MTAPAFFDDFSRGLDTKVWGSWGEPKPYVLDGLLYIPFDPVKTKNTVGVSLRDHSQVFGRFAIRMKATSGHFKTCPLLWPKAGWVAEYDIAEGDNRIWPTQTLHYGDGTSLHGEHHMIHRSLILDRPGLEDWTTIRTTWKKGLLRTTSSRSKGRESLIEDEHVPEIPMTLHIQTGHPSSGAQPGQLVVDWVKVWK